MNLFNSSTEDSIHSCTGIFAPVLMGLNDVIPHIHMECPFALRYWTGTLMLSLCPESWLFLKAGGGSGEVEQQISSSALPFSGVEDRG